MQGGKEVYLHSFLTLALDEGKLSSSLSDQFTPLKEAGHPLNGS